MEDYTLKEPENNVEYFFDIPNNIVLSHVVFLYYDDNDNPIFVNMDTGEPSVISKKQFSYFYYNNLIKSHPSSLSIKQQWNFLMSYCSEHPSSKDRIRSKSDNMRLLRAFKQLSDNQKIELLESAESKNIVNSLSKEQKKLISYFELLSKSEQEGILTQVKYLHDKKLNLIKK